jgi:hypothetical protein
MDLLGTHGSRMLEAQLTIMTKNNHDRGQADYYCSVWESLLIAILHAALILEILQ